MAVQHFFSMHVTKLAAIEPHRNDKHLSVSRFGKGVYTMNATDTHGLHAEQHRRLRRIVRVARMMDTALRIPGTGIRFGADSVIGLIPGIGDAGGAIIALWIVNEARRMGVPKHKVARMVANVGVDALVGSVPLVGDVFDVFFKASRRNLDLILDHFGQENLANFVDFDHPVRQAAHA